MVLYRTGDPRDEKPRNHGCSLILGSGRSLHSENSNFCKASPAPERVGGNTISSFVEFGREHRRCVTSKSKTESTAFSWASPFGSARGKRIWIDGVPRKYLPR